VLRCAAQVGLEWFEANRGPPRVNGVRILEPLRDEAAVVPRELRPVELRPAPVHADPIDQVCEIRRGGFVIGHRLPSASGNAAGAQDRSPSVKRRIRRWVPTHSLRHIASGSGSGSPGTDELQWRCIDSDELFWVPDEMYVAGSRVRGGETLQRRRGHRVLGRLLHVAELAKVHASAGE
jgi:hypothetical protein